MPRYEEGRRSLTAAELILAVLLVATALYLVPSLALTGSVTAVVIAAVLWLGGAGALWLVLRRELRRRDERLRAEALDAERYRTLLEHGAEAYLILDHDGGVRYASPNVHRVLGIRPEALDGNGGVLGLVQESERRPALQAIARLRRSPGSAVAFELRTWYPDGGEGFLDVRATDMADRPAIGGILLGIRDITPRKTFETEIHHLAYYDALTGLANRRFFFEQGNQSLAAARRNHLLAGVLYIDLDGFKQVNDILGHEAGDALLRSVAHSLRGCLRDSDVVARLGGDEFAVVLMEVQDAESAGRVAHRILERMPASAVSEGHEVRIGASIGVAMFPEDGAELEALLKAADLSMYRAKTERTGVQFYRPELRRSLTEQLRMEQELRHGLEHHEFHLHYQPIYNTITGQMAGAEALTRWRHFTRGMVQAAEFIKLAERSGLIRSLDRWAIARAIQQRRALLEGGWTGWVGVNLSPSSLADPGLPAYIRETLEAAELEPGSLVLELPEDTVLAQPAIAADLLWELKNTGAAIALDDYGGGSTPFHDLKLLPIDILKLDPAFVRGIGGDTSDESLIEGVIAIAHGIRSKVLAKGVERNDQVDWLRDAGCDYIQGYLVGLPMAPEDLRSDRGRSTGPEATAGS